MASFVPSCEDLQQNGKNVPRVLFDCETAKIAAKERQLLMAEEMAWKDEDEYAEDMLHHMEQMDVRTLPDVEAINIQEEIEWYMRSFLLNFLEEVHQTFQLLPETLFLAVNILDRYCSKRVVYKRHYQLVGCCSLLIAAKYGDKKDRVPTIKELISVCASLYDEDMFRQMEGHILQTIEWVIAHPTEDAFIKMALLREPSDRELEHMALYIAEMSLYHKDFVSRISSDIARSSLALARVVLGRFQPTHDKWAAQYNHETLVALSTIVYDPPRPLAHKYSKEPLSRSSQVLEHYLVARDAAARVQQQNAPWLLTPSRSGAVTPVEPYADKNALKPLNALPTPPITPQYHGDISHHGKGNTASSYLASESSHVSELPWYCHRHPEGGCMCSEGEGAYHDEDVPMSPASPAPNGTDAANHYMYPQYVS